MMLELSEDHVCTLLFDMPKLIAYYEEMIKNPPEDDYDDPDVDPHLMESMTEVHLTTLREIQKLMEDYAKQHFE